MTNKAGTNASLEPVRIRMYRQGLGDCFLIRFSRGVGETFNLVIDSGVIKGTMNPKVVMREVAEDIERETGGKIDALIVTHEHWDHVSGFTQAREVWERMEIAEVWLAWTEDPKNVLAKKLRKDRENRKTKIKNKIAALAGGSSFRLDSARSGRVDALLGFLGMSIDSAKGNSGGTKQALDYIVGKAKKQIYYDPGTSFVRDDIPGVRIYVLGPPEDEKKIKKSDPSAAHPEVYSDPAHAFAFSGTIATSAEEDLDLPFEDVGCEIVGNQRLYDKYFRKFFPTLAQDAGDPKWRQLNFESISELERLALALDGDTNNTSLALAFELADGRVLLFPADAQVGNWMSWQDYTWKVGSKSVRMDDLLAKTVVYKVGHHGSHNATLRDNGLEKMANRDLFAIVPVNKAMAVKKRWKMPFPPLYRRLIEKSCGRVILADASEDLPKSEQLTDLTAGEQQKFRKTVHATGLFIELSI
jgi:hypothetical protein